MNWCVEAECGGESKKAMETDRMCLNLLFYPYLPLFGTHLGMYYLQKLLRWMLAELLRALPRQR